MTNGAKKSGSHKPSLEARAALALSAGGARGAYQIGSWRALTERGISFAAVAGSSIGAVNGALVCQGQIEKACQFWEELGKSSVLRLDYDQLRKIAVRLGLDLAMFLVPVPNLALLKVIKYAFSTARVFSSSGSLGTLSREGLVDLERLEPFLERYLDLRWILKQPVPLFVTAYKVPTKSHPKGGSHWFRLQDFSEKEARTIMAASISLPLVFPSIELDGKFYRDGGISDWVPVRPLYENGYRKIVVVATKPRVAVVPDRCPGSRMLVIKPKKSLARFPVSTFRFSRKTIDQWMNQGYEDAVQALKKSDTKWLSNE